jgi:hypothetical protein
VGTPKDMNELINQWLWKRSSAFYKSFPKAPTDVQGLVWLTDGSGTECGTEAGEYGGMLLYRGLRKASFYFH